MGLNDIRDQWESFIEPLVSKLGFLDPNHISWFSLLLAGAACYFFATSGTDHAGGIRILGAVGLVIAASACDTLDGNIARKFDKVSDYGDFLDHTIDRIVDVALIVAIGANVAWGEGNAHLGYFAALFTLLGSYMGTQAQSVGLGRNYGGFGRADRLIVTILGGFVAAYQALTDTWTTMMIPLIDSPINGLTVVLLFSLLGGLYTFLVRFSAARKELMER